MPYAPPTRLVADLFQQIKRVFGDESNAQLENADLVMFTNSAIDEINYRNRVLKASATLPAVSGQAEYTFPTQNILQIEALLFNGALVRNISYAMALENYIGQMPETGNADPLYWWEWAGNFTFWPTPATGTIRLDYTVRHTPVTGAPGEVIPLPDKFYNDIIARVLQQGYELDEQPELANYQAQTFSTSLANHAEEERAAQEMYYPIITLMD